MWMRGIPANTSSAGQDRDLHALEVTSQDSGETIMTINDELTDEILRCWMSDFVFFFFFFYCWSSLLLQSQSISRWPNEDDPINAILKIELYPRDQREAQRVSDKERKRERPFFRSIWETNEEYLSSFARQARWAICKLSQSFTFLRLICLEFCVEGTV